MGEREELMQVTFTSLCNWISDFISQFGVSVGAEVWGLVGVI